MTAAIIVSECIISLMISKENHCLLSSKAETMGFQISLNLRTLIWPGSVWLSSTCSHFTSCVWCLMRLLPCFLGAAAPGFRCWQADNVFVLGCPGGTTLGLPEEARLLLLPAGKWKLLLHPLYVVFCVVRLGQKNVLSQEKGGGGGDAEQWSKRQCVADDGGTSGKSSAPT